MQSGRILIVSDRKEVVAELEPIIRAGQHLVASVPDGVEAVRLLDEGLVPDLVVTDLGSDRSLEGMEYLWRFRELNRVGQHMVVVESGAPFTAPAGAAAERMTVLPRPFQPAAVQQAVDAAVSRISRDLHALRGEMCREVSRLHGAIRDAQKEMVGALALTVSARDPYMQGHAARVAELCVRVARALHVDPAEVDLLESAAILHEIGKVGVPVELLHKTDPLRHDELAQIRSHPRIGAEIVRGVPSLKRLAPIVEHQGVDYADLAGVLDPSASEFLLVSILRVVDAYDAMVSARSYRAPMPRQYWEAHLRDGAGRRFHPGVVRAFFAAVAVSSPETRPLARTA
ncbi:MAG TPA: HD domain-containing phosphohydrolase [Longimicrobiaceae bacterium]|jgi:response regulator RpfG family c-di-GMP phosphodiesterase|nr:HD domain-containing phosphohydrolase [Longimicrobiaceae bacterium]